MEFNRQKYEYFFPRKVYHCAYLGEVVQKRLRNDDYRLVDIVDNISNFNFYDKFEPKVFSVKCGDNNKDCIFVCEKHLGIVLFAKRQFVCTENETSQNATVKYADGKKETYCKGCIKHYLKLMFHYFNFADFE